MPLDILTTADNVRVTGSMTVINDPQGNPGNVNIVGALTASGAVTLPGFSGTNNARYVACA